MEFAILIGTIIISTLMILSKIDDISVNFTVEVSKDEIKKELLKELKENNKEDK